jgi:uncharacterized protein (TIGR04255 family)
VAIPDSRRVVFRRNPLAEVICQFRFPTILAISAEPPAEFQERVRESYPLFEKAEPSPGWPSELAPVLSRLPVQLAAENAGYKFLTEDRHRSISLTQDFVAVSESSYTRWEQFRRELELAERAAREVYRPAFYSRVGLRYQNLIDKVALGLEGNTWRQMIKPLFAGLLCAEELADRVQQTVSQTVVRIDEVQGARVKLIHGLVQAVQSQRLAYLIDADFFMEERCDSERAFAALDVFHGLAGNLFRWAITDTLERALEPVPAD